MDNCTFSLKLEATISLKRKDDWFYLFMIFVFECRTRSNRWREVTSAAAKRIALWAVPCRCHYQLRFAPNCEIDEQELMVDVGESPVMSSQDDSTPMSPLSVIELTSCSMNLYWNYYVAMIY